MWNKGSSWDPWLNIKDKNHWGLSFVIQRKFILWLLVIRVCWPLVLLYIVEVILNIQSTIGHHDLMFHDKYSILQLVIFVLQWFFNYIWNDITCANMMVWYTIYLNEYSRWISLFMNILIKLMRSFMSNLCIDSCDDFFLCSYLRGLVCCVCCNKLLLFNVIICNICLRQTLMS